MAQTTQSSYTLTFSPTTPAYIFVGPHESALDALISWLQKIVCKHNGCTVCAPCRQIQLQQHHSMLWLYPEKQYTLEQLEPISNQLAFTLEEDEHYFIIIQKADLLSPSCANTLLKSLEEPPRGYHFVLLTHNPQALLPTIHSRCIQHILPSWQSPEQHPLIPFFTGQARDAATFLQTLEKHTPTEHESAQLLDALITHWSTQLQQQTIACNQPQIKHAQKNLALFIHALDKLPMAGSSKLFWKNLFILPSA